MTHPFPTLRASDLNIPPQFGSFAGDPRSDGIVLNRPGSLFLGRSLASDGPVLTARSVARASFSASGHYCVWVMNPEMRAALKISGGAVVNQIGRASCRERVCQYV